MLHRKYICIHHAILTLFNIRIQHQAMITRATVAMRIYQMSTRSLWILTLCNSICVCSRWCNSSNKVAPGTINQRHSSLFLILSGMYQWHRMCTSTAPLTQSYYALVWWLLLLLPPRPASRRNSDSHHRSLSWKRWDSLNVNATFVLYWQPEATFRQLSNTFCLNNHCNIEHFKFMKKRKLWNALS